MSGRLDPENLFNDYDYEHDTNRCGRLLIVGQALRLPNLPFASAFQRLVELLNI